MFHHDVEPHNIINKNGHFSHQITNLHTEDSTVCYSDKKSEQREEKDDFRHCHVDDYGPCQKMLEPPCLGEIFSL
jgi:hypothetical protein